MNASMARRGVLAKVAAAAAAMGLRSELLAAAATTSSYSWHRPIVNGGHGHVCAFDPVTGEAAFGGDVWGFHATTDIFGEWRPTMMGQTGIGGIYSRALAYSLATPGTRYCGVGTLKSPGGYFGVSVGNALTSRSTKIGFGSSLTGSAGSPDPRPAGRQIHVQMINGVEVIWAVGHQGIAKSTDGGKTWTTPLVPAPSGTAWKAVCGLDANTALACRWRARGLWMVKNGVASQIADPGILHSINKINGTVWACGPGGLYKWNGSSFSWHPFFPTGVEVSDIDGSPDGMTLYVCTANQTTAAKDAYKSTDGGSSWATIGQNTKPTLFSGKPFWLQTVVHNHFGDTNWSGTMVAVNPLDPDMVLFAGKNGGAGSKDGGATIYQCAPGGDEVNGLRAGPGASEFWATDTDWTGVHTTDGWQTYAKTTTPGSVSTSLTQTVGGHTYQVHLSNPRDITKDGVSIADDVFRGGCIQPTGLAISSDGTITVSLYTGGVLVGR